MKLFGSTLRTIEEQSIHLLKNGGLNLRERLNIYGGMIFGFVAPIIAARYLAFPLGSKTLEEEAIKWASSLPAVITCPITLPLGTALGNYSAKTNREIREEEEIRNLGKILEI